MPNKAVNNYNKDKIANYQIKLISDPRASHLTTHET